MRTRRIIWLLAALLSLGTLQLAPAARVAPCSETRVEAVKTAPLRSRLGKKLASQRHGLKTVAFATRQTNASFEESRPRFQLPPPFIV